MTTFPCRSNDFCLEHGYEHMRSSLGNPICFCVACEQEAEKALSNEGAGPSKAIRYTEAEWAVIMDLRAHWEAFCDADPFDGADTFIERMEAAGFIDMRTATKRDVEATSFAEELGIVAGQPIWVLTKKGHAALTPATPSNAGGGLRTQNSQGEV